MIKQAKVQPVYLKGKKPAKIALHDVMDVLKMIDDHGHSKKFKSKAKAAGAMMTVSPETVNFIKDFVADNNMHGHRIGKKVVNQHGNDCDNYECKFGK